MNGRATIMSVKLKSFEKRHPDCSIWMMVAISLLVLTGGSLAQQSTETHAESVESRSEVSIQNPDKTNQSAKDKTNNQKPTAAKASNGDSPDTPDDAAPPKVAAKESPKYVIPDVPHVPR